MQTVLMVLFSFFSPLFFHYLYLHIPRLIIRDIITNNTIFVILYIKRRVFYMKLDDKKKKIQLKYREEMQRKSKGTYKESFIVVMIIFLLFVLNSCIKSF
jgi:hypothetical protein